MDKLKTIMNLPLSDLFSHNQHIDTNTFTESIEEIQIRLKFIGRIEVGDKINVRNLFLQPDGLITKVSRTFINTDNRKNTMKFVKDVITRTFEIINLLILSNDILTCKNIIYDLFSSRKGLVNLKNTYNDDVMFLCNLETLLQKIETYISNLRLTHQSLFDENNESKINEIKKE